MGGLSAAAVNDGQPYTFADSDPTRRRWYVNITVDDRLIRLIYQMREPSQPLEIAARMVMEKGHKIVRLVDRPRRLPNACALIFTFEVEPPIEAWPMSGGLSWGPDGDPARRQEPPGAEPEPKPQARMMRLRKPNG